MKKYRAKANTNIALIKYWGKRDEKLIIPNTSSISLTLEELYAVTEVSFIDEDEDLFILDNKIQNEFERNKISKFIDIFREKSNIKKNVLVKSFNHVPFAAGLASSSSGFAALATALNKLFELNFSKKDLSKISRRGSGSSTRSIFGGIVEWQAGFDDDSSYANQLSKDDLGLAMIIIVVNSKQKSISSREAMKKTIESSPLYDAYIQNSKKDYQKMLKAIEEKNLEEIGKITEHNAMQMHATIISSNPPIIYFEEESIKIIKKVQDLRKEGLFAYFTMDAGPNVKILVKKSEINSVYEELQKEISKDKMIITHIAKEDASVEEII